MILDNFNSIFCPGLNYQKLLELLVLLYRIDFFMLENIIYYSFTHFCTSINESAHFQKYFIFSKKFCNLNCKFSEAINCISIHPAGLYLVAAFSNKVIFFNILIGMTVPLRLDITTLNWKSIMY